MYLAGIFTKNPQATNPAIANMPAGITVFGPEASKMYQMNPAERSFPEMRFNAQAQIAQPADTVAQPSTASLSYGQPLITPHQKVFQAETLMKPLMEQGLPSSYIPPDAYPYTSIYRVKSAPPSEGMPDDSIYTEDNFAQIPVTQSYIPWLLIAGLGLLCFINA